VDGLEKERDQKMSEKSLQKIEPAGAVDIEALLIAAMEKGPDVVERMMVVRRELCAEAAKAMFDQAIRDFQSECPPIGKGKTVKNDSGATLYHYAPFENILSLVKPAMQKYGLSFTLDTDTESKDGWVIATCKITHTGGHSEVSRAKFPLGGGTRAMSTTQVFAAALSFASRRVFCNALGIVTVGEDFDGADARAKQHGPSAKPEDAARDAQKKLWGMLKPVRGTANNWTAANNWLRSQKILNETQIVTDLTVGELEIVIGKSEIAMGDAQ
jgi:hypothetical protein